MILSLLANDDCFNGGSELLEDESRSHQSEKYHLDEGSVVDAGLAQVWSITQFYFVGLLQLKERCKKCVIQTHNQGLCLLFMTESWDKRATSDCVLVSRKF